MQLTLEQYLNRFAWSQAELCRQADVSEGVVRRALNGETIARRNAEKIINALDRKFREKGAQGHIVMGSIKGLQIAELQRKKPNKQTAGKAHHI